VGCSLGFLSLVHRLVVGTSWAFGLVFLRFDFGFKLGYLCILSCVLRGALHFI
jgi:hypothetical protein